MSQKSIMVVYQSSTGFTKKYAQWIAEALDCEMMDIKKASEDILKREDIIVYGGWIMGGMIMGLDKVFKMNPKHLVVYAVGASQPSADNSAKLIETNHLDNVPFYYLEGGINFEKLGFIQKTVLKMVRKSIAKKSDKTDGDAYMEKAMSGSFDKTEADNINELVELVKKQAESEQ